MKRTFVLIAVLALGMGVAACGKSGYTLTSQEKTTLDLGGREFSERAGMTFVSCSGQDSDRVGYSTCTAKDRNNEFVELRCTYAEKGCKLKPRS